MKKQAIAAILMAAFAAPAFADNFETQVFNNTPEQQVQVEELSQKEMKETEGAFTLPELSVTQSMMTGGALNTGFYYAGADNPTLKGAVLAASVGAVTSVVLLPLHSMQGHTMRQQPIFWLINFSNGLTETRNF